MNIIRVNSYDELSRITAEMIEVQILQKPNSVLGLATGTSPLGTYDYLVEEYKKGILDFSNVKTINLDEYYGLDETNPQSYRYFMNTKLFDKINIAKENTFLPNGKADDINRECKRYHSIIARLGGIDLQLLGIGYNGHIGFNEPSDIFSKAVHTVALTESTIEANSRLFASIEDVPKKAITIGIGEIMKARKIVLIAGKEKSEIVEKAFCGDITPNVPASILQLHNDFTVVTVK
jgi:glucosamine-6-phosphate deaminase